MDGQHAPWWTGKRGEWWVLAQVALLAAIIIVPGAGPLWRANHWWVRVVGGCCLGIGLVFMFLGVRTLGPTITIWPKPRADARLVTSGVYGIVRHPIYGGLVFCAIGVALWRNSTFHLGLAMLLLVVLNAKVFREERWLRERFPEYARYSQTVRKFIPGVY